ncbi:MULTISPECIES: GNAT family N-acetyltransferase [Auritidibacter]|uniref:Lysine N-acyltransferase MbtK n=1 Tax=Auritidibacter ignavus TaxID=678932 RepID=A0AAJ6AGE3_9MICC|nr:MULTISPECIES: GNAT family N-acetyltransferase [Auritidibacter]AXR74729.1 GNAT family N-acetyltransferase [Auritidibacter sp. NML130574]NIH71119.1 siderophore synthetase component/RimJ/RimL family protein N-acetyltransferase [Auritidibacter ignavus]PXA75282.1 siderophore synthetase [Auritidibacter sp. NML100628]PXA78715.1 siderophore synthetase [Auritidibacter sp. NML120636]RMX21467.1 GNAT family N-acetyltransferase [Auritidibacter ignavus]
MTTLSFDAPTWQLTHRFTAHPIDPHRDAPLLHQWLTHPSAKYWQMLHYTQSQVQQYLQAITDSQDEQGWLLHSEAGPVAYIETYNPQAVLLTDVFAAEDDDIGMHLLVAPAPENPALRQHGLTTQVMEATVELCFNTGARRIVVEPDIENTRIHRKNQEAGFQFLREIDLPGKRAALSVLEKDKTAAAGAGLTDHLEPAAMAVAQRHLVTKALSEFAHEKLITPHAETSTEQLDDETAEEQWFSVKAGESTYRFQAQHLALSHWEIDQASLQRLQGDAKTELNAQELIIELNSALAIPEHLLDTYLEEIASTLASAAYKHHIGGPTAEQLARGRRDLDTAGDYQQTEASMTEGHPCFVATNGRIGFSLDDFLAYAPETGQRFRYLWLAARRNKTEVTLGKGLAENHHWNSELGTETLSKFEQQLNDQGLDPAEYTLMPVHPWQFRHRVAITFAPEIARHDLIVLGEAEDLYQPQQSIRTTFNRSNPQRSYVKTALSIQNMGFLRGQSPEFMRFAPAISDWVAQTVRTDPVLQQMNFDVLREHAAIGFTGDVYHQTPRRSDQKKMLSVLWRESPIPRLEQGERLMTMAALLHRDAAGTAVTPELIKHSGLSAQEWIRQYLTSYLAPLVHCLEAHELAFMPHGENLILRIREGVVTGVLMKDLGEEIGILGDRPLPPELGELRRIQDPTEHAQRIFTDVFIGFLRHLGALLHVDRVLPEDKFWALVSETIAAQQAQSPGRRRVIDFTPESFDQCCHNRLQLKNTLEMVSLEDTAGSLIYVGQVSNPIGEQQA